MIDPGTALIIGVVIVAGLTYLFYPDKGFIARLNRNKRNSIRVLVEDALKHLYDCEYKRINCTLHSIAGSLHISGDKATELVERLEEMGLTKSNGEIIELASEGRSYALRIIRVHRLWERYLADETSVHETEWHTKAEEVEHKMSDEEADSLAASLGNPIIDPHGDPIPSSKGEVPGKKGMPITSLREGEVARISHIEDEPAAIYAQLVAEGLHLNMQLRVIEKTEDKIKFVAEGEEIVLTSLFANNISVEPIIAQEEVQQSYRTLSSLKIGEKGTVIGISKALRGQQRRRLLDMGVVPGAKITKEMESFGSDPVAFQIKGSTLALRKNQTNYIYLQDNEGNESAEKENDR